MSTETLQTTTFKPLDAGSTTVDVNTQKNWYRLIHQARLVDDRARKYLRQAKGWSYHASHAGHDGIQVALGLAFRPNVDWMFPYYRDMLTCLAAGVTPYELILNGLSKADDIASGGRHMSNHFAKIPIGIWNVSSATGNHTLHAAGLARAAKYYGVDRIAFSSQGESSTSEGYVYEALNGASRERLPAIFVVQNNGYGISVPTAQQSANVIVSENYRGLKHLLIVNCDGTNPFDSWRAMQEAIAYVKSGEGPALVHALCRRIFAHSNSDRHELYRTPEEIAECETMDPLPRLKAHLLEEVGVAASELDAIEAENHRGVDDAAERGDAAPDPDPETATRFVIPDQAVVPAEELEPKAGGELLTMREGINHTLIQEFRRNPNTFCWGQDVASKEKGGVFNVTKGMAQEFGDGRVFNAPIAEDFISGTANGFARYSPDVWVLIEGAQFADYYWPAAEQLIEFTHEYYRSNGQFVPNVIVRLASGGYIGGGLYHSQNLEAVFQTLPGLRVVVPAFADDAVGMLRQAFRTRGITFFLEPKYLYNQIFAKAADPGPDYRIPFGKARIRREGTDLTILTYGTTVHWSLRAANQLKEDHDVDVEVVDLRSIVPLDMETIVASVKKTSRVLIVHEDKVTGGVGAEIAARITEQCFEFLDAPIMRVGSADCPVPFSRILERAVLPQVEDVYDKALQVLSY
jgi:2-oxoisovalerate dehydrogenase E1 component